MKKTFLIFIIICSAVFAQNKKLTGNLYMDSKLYEVKLGNNNSNELNHKNGIIAGALSALVPGAGQLYTGYYLKSALFAALEAVAIYYAVDYNDQGDNLTVEYKKYAETHWDPAKYARNSIINFGLDPDDYKDLFKNEEMTEIDYSKWNLIHKIEEDVAKLPEGKYYSHKLANFGEQQYYEMIGKYPQFNNGWDDFNATQFNYHTPLTERFLQYSSMRGEANDKYDKSNAFVAVIIVNHVISAIDAVLDSKWYNENVKINAEVERENIGFRNIYYPKVNLSLRF